MNEKEPSRIKKLILFLKALELGLVIKLGDRYFSYDAPYIMVKYPRDKNYFTSSEDINIYLDEINEMDWQYYVNLSLQVAEKLGEKNVD